MRPAARRRLLLLVLAVGPPLMLTAGVAAWLASGGVERRLEWTWNEELDLPGDLAVGRAAVDGPGVVVLDEVAITSSGNTVVTIAQLRATDGDGARDLQLTGMTLDLGPDGLAYLERLMPQLNEAGAAVGPSTWTLDGGQVVLLGGERIAVSGNGRRDEVVSGDLTARFLDADVAIALGGTPSVPTFTLQAPVTVPVDRALAVAEAYGLTLPLEPALLPGSVELRELSLHDGEAPRLAGKVGWPAEHPWPIDAVRFAATPQTLDLVIDWRVAGDDLTLTVAVVDDVVRATVSDGQLPIEPWWPLLIPSDMQLLRGVLTLAVPPLIQLRGSSFARDDEGVSALDLHAEWPGGSLTQHATVARDGALAVGIELDDQVRGALSGTLQVEDDLVSFGWSRLRIPPTLLKLVPAGFDRIPVDALIEALGDTTVQWVAGSDTFNVRGDGVLAVVQNGPDGFSLSARGIPLSLMTETPMIDTAAGAFEVLELATSGGEWIGTGTLMGSPSLRSGAVAFVPKRVAFVPSGSTDHSAPLDELQYAGDQLLMAFVIGGAAQMPWPNEAWAGRAVLRRDLGLPGWEVLLDRASLAGVVEDVAATGRVTYGPDGAQVELDTWRGAWMPPVLRELLADRSVTALEWSGRSGRFALGADVLAVQSRAWRCDVVRNADELRELPSFAAIARELDGRWSVIVEADRGALLPEDVSTDGPLDDLLARDDAIRWPQPKLDAATDVPQDAPPDEEAP